MQAWIKRKPLCQLPRSDNWRDHHSFTQPHLVQKVSHLITNSHTNTKALVRGLQTTCSETTKHLQCDYNTLVVGLQSTCSGSTKALVRGLKGTCTGATKKM